MATGMPRSKDVPRSKARSLVKAAALLSAASVALVHVQALRTFVPLRRNPVHVPRRGAVLSRAASANEARGYANFEEFTQRAGPPAVEKMAEFVEVAEESKDAWPERVKLHFQDASGAEVTRVWSPRQQPLHEIFMRFKQTIYDFSLTYLDEDGDEVAVDPSKFGVEAMVESMAGKTVRITVAWHPPSPTEWVAMSAGKKAQEASASVQQAIRAAKMWISGGGKATKEEVSAAEKQVEKSGGRIVPNKAKGALVRYQGCDLQHWESVCENLQKELKPLLFL